MSTRGGSTDASVASRIGSRIGGDAMMTAADLQQEVLRIQSEIETERAAQAPLEVLVHLAQALSACKAERDAATRSEREKRSMAEVAEALVQARDADRPLSELISLAQTLSTS